MAQYNIPKRATAFKFYIGLVDQSNTKLLKANPTIASGDFKVSKDGGAFANLTTLPSANPASGTAVMIDLSSTEMTADNVVVQCIDASGAEWCDQLINLQPSVNQIDDLASSLTTIAAYIDTEVAAIKAKTDNLPSDPASAANIGTLVLAATVEGSTTVAESLRLANATLGGKASGLDTTTAVYRDLADSKNRISATVDTNGNRTAVTRDLT